MHSSMKYILLGFVTFSLCACGGGGPSGEFSPPVPQDNN